jgi:hypothetical protein
MGSVNVQTFVTKMAEKVREKKLIKMGEIALDSGYSKMVANSPTKITRTKTYAKLAKPLVERLDNEIDEIEKNMRLKDKSKEEYRTLIGSLDILIKNRQLLSGGATERQVFVLPSEVIQQNNITVNDNKGLIEPPSSES